MSNDEEVLYEGLGIVDVGPGMNEGRSYAVSFTLFVDASSPHQALERATATSSGPEILPKFGVFPSNGTFMTYRTAEPRSKIIGRTVVRPWR